MTVSLTLHEALQVAQLAPEGLADCATVAAALSVLADRLTSPGPLPRVTILLDDRREARDLADQLAEALDAVMHADPYDELPYVEALMQTWHERSWGPT